MNNRNGSFWVALLAILMLVGFLGYKAAYPSHLVRESDDTALLQTIATNSQAESDLRTPTVTTVPSLTPTRSPVPPSPTLEATYVGQASPEPGIYVVPQWTPTPADQGTSEPDALPPCITVTPAKYDKQYCLQE